MVIPILTLEEVVVIEKSDIYKVRVIICYTAILLMVQETVRKCELFLAYGILPCYCELSLIGVHIEARKFTEKNERLIVSNTSILSLQSVLFILCS